MTLISKSEYARHRKVTPAQVTHWLKAGRISIVDGKVDPVASDAMLAKTLNPIQGGKRARHDSKVRENVTPPVQEIHADAVSSAVVADKTVSTQLKRVKLEREAGRLVDRAKYDLATESAFAGLRDQLLAIPRRLSGRLAAETDERRCDELLTAELAKVLNHGADAQEALADAVGETTQ